MNPPMIRTPDESEDGTLPTIYDSPTTTADRQARAKQVETIFKTTKPVLSPGSFSYLTPEYRRDRAKDELTKYDTALDSVIKKNPDTSIAEIAEIIKNDLDTYFEKRMAILNEAMEKTRALESDRSATKRDILLGGHKNSHFVGKEIKQKEIEKIISHSLEQIKSDNPEDAEELVAEIRDTFRAELSDELNAKSAEVYNVQHEQEDSTETQNASQEALNDPVPSEPPKTQLSAALEAARQKAEAEGKPLEVKDAASVEKAESSPLSQEVRELRETFEATKKLREGIKRTKENEEALRELWNVKEVELYRYIKNATNEKTESAKKKLLDETKALFGAYDLRVKELLTASPEPTKAQSNPDPVAPANPEPGALPAASPESYRYLPNELWEGQVFFLPKDQKSSRANWKIIKNTGSGVIMRQLDGEGKGREEFFGYRQLRNILYEVQGEQESFEQAELEKNRATWAEGVKKRPQKVLRPVQNDPTQEAGFKKFEAGDMVRLMDSHGIQDWTIVRIESTTKGRTVAALSHPQFGTRELPVKKLRRLVNEVREYESTGPQAKSEPISQPKPLAFDVDSDIQDDEASPEMQEKFYIGKTITIPDGKQSGAWSVESVGSRGATLKRVGGSETIRKNYLELERLVAQYESEHEGDEKDPQAPQAQERGKEKFSNPPVGTLIAMFDGSRGNTKAMYDGYVAWERKWLTNNAIDDLREKTGNIKVSPAQLESTRKLLNAYKKMLRLDAEGKHILDRAIDGIEGNMTYLVKILSGRHHDDRSAIKYLVETYDPKNDAAQLQRIEKITAETEAGKSGKAERTQERHETKVEKLEDWAPVIRRDFEAHKKRIVQIKSDLPEHEVKKFATEEAAIADMLENFDDMLKDIADLRKEIQELEEEIESVGDNAEDSEALIQRHEELVKAEKRMHVRNNAAAQDIYKAVLAYDAHINTYAEIMKQKSKILSARENVWASSDAKDGRFGYKQETAEEWRKRDEERVAKDKERDARAKKAITEHHKYMSGEKEDPLSTTSSKEKLSQYIDLYMDRVDLGDEVRYYLKHFDETDPLKKIVKARLKNEDDLIFILTGSDHPENQGKIIKIILNEKDADQKQRQEYGRDPTTKEMLALRYSPEAESKKPEDKYGPQQAGLIRTAGNNQEGGLELGVVDNEMKAAAVNTTWGTRLKRLLGGPDGLRWWKIAGPLAIAVMPAVLYNSSGNNPGTSPETGAGTPTIETGTKPKQSFESELSPELQTFLQRFLAAQGTEAVDKFILDSVPSEDPSYGKTLLNAQAWPLFHTNDAGTPGRVDQNQKDHHEEISKFIKNLQQLAKAAVIHLRSTPGSDPSLLIEAIRLSTNSNPQGPSDTNGIPQKNLNLTTMSLHDYTDRVYALVADSAFKK